MVIEYPNYYPEFHCIAGDCPETCCAGWEVDLDEDALTYYREIAPAPFGDVIRSHIAETPEGDAIFPLTEKGRCPFLNEQNLCDIILHLGENRLCRTCAEHPRFVVEVADYRQYDLSLSCPEASRLFFRDDFRFSVIRQEKENPAYLTDSYLDDINFTTCLEVRDKALSILGKTDLPLPKRLAQVEEYVLIGKRLPKESNEALLKLLKDEDPWDPRWAAEMKQMKELLPHINETLEALFLWRNQEILERNFEKLSMYLAFRYFPDSYYDDSPVCGLKMMRRSMRLLYLLAFSHWWAGEQKASKTGLVAEYHLTNQDFMEFCHAYSKEVEHDDKNIAAFKS